MPPKRESPVVCTCQKETCAVPSRPSPDKACCCTGRCTCKPRCECECRRGRSRSESRHRHHGRSGSRCGHGTGGRRCPYCLPERAAVEEASLLERQERYQRTRAEHSQRRHQLAQETPCTDTWGAYRRNTADMLRANYGSLYQRAMDREQNSRRRELQRELDSRRGEIDQLRRSKDAYRSASEYSSSSSRARANEAYYYAPLANRERDCGCDGHARRPPPPRGPAKKTPPPPPAAARGGCHCNPCDCTPCRCAAPPAPHHCKKMPPPPAHGQCWCPEPCNCSPCRCAAPPAPHHCKKMPPPPAHGQCWCPEPCNCSPCRCAAPPAPHHGKKMPPPPAHGQCWCPEPCNCSPCRCAAPPAPHHGKKMPPPPAHGQCWCPEPCNCSPCRCAAPPAPHHGKKMPPPPAHGQCWCPEPCNCSPCRCAAPPHAADVVARMASGHYNVCPCPGCERGDGCQRRRPHSAGGRAGSRHRDAPRPATSGPLAAPKYGRKVFITDDAYLARRADYMSAWEQAGTLEAVGPSSRSLSAALPEKTPKWRTIEADSDDEGEY